MPDPILDEGGILVGLDAISSPHNAERILGAAFLVLVDAFDREIEREAFVELANRVVAIHDLLGRLQIVNSMSRRFEENTLDKKMLDQAIQGITLRAEDFRRQLMSQMELVAQCPLKGDTRH